MELRPDVVLAGTLRLVRPLGRGGMGVVWVARHLRLETDVAVKLIRPDRAASNPALLRRFEREAKAAARIAHPNVVRVMDYGVVDAVPYIVMELLAGFSLDELLERGGRLSLRTAKSLARQVGSALESAHAQGVVHRDIKPHNVFVTEGSREHALVVKVLDFGVAKVDAGVPGGTAALTETGVVVGSAPYMSPEQLEGRSDVDLRSDLWALGVVLYESLTGQLPFQGGSFVTVGKAVLDGRYRPASELRPDLPSGIDDWFAKALCVDPDGRFQTAAAMVDAFGELTELPGAASMPLPLLEGGDDVALATTEAAKVLSPKAGDDITATHAPVAKKPPADEGEPSVGGRWSWRRVVIAVGALAVVGGGAAFVRMRSAGGGHCPAGMVRVSGATFDMGTPGGADTPQDEEVHRTTVADFCIDVTEVTVKAYSQHEAPPGTVKFAGLSSNGEKFHRQFCNTADKPDHPINCVDFNQAKAYCTSVGKRLPTEPEWELAARGTERRMYPWGSEPPTKDRLNVCGPECIRMLTDKRAEIGKPPPGYGPMHSGDDGSAATAPVGSYPAGASAVGALDMAGNVWEWTESLYCDYGTTDCSDFRHVLRGGGWDTPEPSDVRAAKRLAAEPTYRARGIGFRCAKTP